MEPPLPLIPAGMQSYVEVTSNKHIVLKEADFIYIQRGAVAGPFAQAYISPFQVLCWMGKVYAILMGGRVERVAADQLKPHCGDPLAVPPKRVRPPGTGGSVYLVGPGLEGGPCGVWRMRETGRKSASCYDITVCNIFMDFSLVINLLFNC